MRNSINILKYLDFLGKCTTVAFLLSRENVMVELGTAISVSADLAACLVFTASHAFLEELNFSTLHYLLQVIFL